MSTEQLFNAAVNVIRSLPKNGPFNPSDELKLKFYAYFKQATEGPNETKKPAFYDIVNKYKWEAWKRLGDMPKQKAMEYYVDELKKVVETMSINEAVTDFYEVLGPFYEFLPPESVASLQISNHLINGDNGEISDENQLACNPEFIRVGKKPSSKFVHKDISPPNGDDDYGNDSDADEFSDTYDRIEQDGIIPIAARNGSDSLESVIETRGSLDLNPPTAMSSSNTNQSRNPSAIRTRNNAREARMPSTRPLGTSTGGSGGPGDGNTSNPPDYSIGINEQLALAVIRLQQSMDQVVNRLDTLESMLTRDSQMRLQARSRSCFWPFNEISSPTIFLIIVWPFMVQWIVHIIRQKNRLNRK